MSHIEMLSHLNAAFQSGDFMEPFSAGQLVIRTARRSRPIERKP